MMPLMWGCLKDEEKFDENTIVRKTVLFDEVTDPEPSGSEGAYAETLRESTSKGSEHWSGGKPNGQFGPGILTAGEWSDLDNWDFWNNLLNNQRYFEDVEQWNLKEIKRYSFEVADANGSMVANAEITLFSGKVEVWKAKTDNKGKASLWSDLGLDKLIARIKFEDMEVFVDALEYSQGINKVYLKKKIDNKKIVDVYFAVDATGSMGDEIDYLKAELNDVIKRIRQKNAALKMRFGSVFYRDEGDEYVTRPFSFTSDETSLVSFISEQDAQGGGDYPEAVHTALDVAITQNSWNDEATARILFLLLDAPPHYTQEVVSSLELNLAKAAEEGIKIVPITASGIDKPTEYLMRSFAILTNGTYVFITDDSGIGNDHLEPTIGDFELEKLNDLLVRLVSEYVP
ncbi:MAG: hypothetical protein CSA36_01790 [Draconibacterium sp.]|nr:MAG: hypothetical protein CSA36_01790 [Draconibacterium sp.]